MQQYSRSHLTDEALRQTLRTRVALERSTTAELIADLAELDHRKLYLTDGYPSLYAYCVRELGFSEDVACDRIDIARAVQAYPAILEGIADGRFHLTGLRMLIPRMDASNWEKLLADTAHKTKTEIELLLARRCPRPDVPTRIEPIVSSVRMPLAGPTVSDPSVPERINPRMTEQSSAAAMGQEAAAVASIPRPSVRPTAPQRFALQVAIDQETYDALQYAKALLGHQVPSGDLAMVLKLALDALVAKLEKHKFATTSRPRAANGQSASISRHIPAAVKRQVLERDGARCTYVSPEGRRCESSTRLEFDHMIEFALGGETAVENLRLLCRAHNQHTAEGTFGREFIRRKRDASNQRPRSARSRNLPSAREERAKVQARALAAELSRQGFTRDEVGRAVAYSETMDEVSLAQRLATAVSFLRATSAPSTEDDEHQRAWRILLTNTVPSTNHNAVSTNTTV